MKKLRWGETTASILIVLATIIQFTNSSWQRKINDSKDVIFDRNISLAQSSATFAANSAEILLQRDLLEVCIINKHDGCGSVEYLLNSAVNSRDGIRAGTSLAVDNLKKAVTEYEDVYESHKFRLFCADILFYIFMTLAFISTLFSIRKK